MFALTTIFAYLGGLGTLAFVAWIFTRPARGAVELDELVNRAAAAAADAAIARARPPQRAARQHISDDTLDSITGAYQAGQRSMAGQPGTPAVPPFRGAATPPPSLGGAYPYPGNAAPATGLPAADGHSSAGGPR